MVVTKRRASAFARGSDLDMVLRAAGIEVLVLSGIATSGVVLSTVRQAADLDFSLTVLADACVYREEEVHRVLCQKVLARQAKGADRRGMGDHAQRACSGARSETQGIAWDFLTLAFSGPARGALFERGDQARGAAGKSLQPQRFAVQVVLPAHEATASSYIPVVGL
jgi:hypothetical protein